MFIKFMFTVTYILRLSTENNYSSISLQVLQITNIAYNSNNWHNVGTAVFGFFSVFFLKKKIRKT